MPTTASRRALPDVRRFGLVLLESMAWCIPIASDVPYGPAGVTTDGADGFLVAAGDPDALAAGSRCAPG